MKSSILVLLVLLIVLMGVSVIAADAAGNAPPNPSTMPPTVQCAVAGDSCAATTSAGEASSTCCPDLQCQNGVCTEHKGFVTRILNFFGIGSASNPPGPGEDQGVPNSEPSTNGQDQGASGGANGQDQGSQGTNGQDQGTGANGQGNQPGTGSSETGGQSAPVGPPVSQPPGACCRVTVCGQGATEYICPPGQQCGQDCRTITCQQQDYCEYNGAEYKEGESFPDSDGCNTCTCSNGRIICTERPCIQCDQDVQTCYPPTTATTAAPQSTTPIRCEGTYDDCVEKYGKCDCGYKEQVTCKYTGVEYKEGESFPDSDGCNTCTCSNGKIICTEHACQSDCKETVNECFGVTAAAPIKCVGTYDYCVEKYGKCDCGYPTDQPQPVGCTYDDATYKEGESFPDSDGCNTCTCSNGRIICTEHACQVECEEKVNTCYSATSATPIKCEGTYDDCTKTYGKCDCGYTESTTSVTTKPIVTTQPPVKLG